MWLIQECKSVWDDEVDVAWETLITEAEAAEPFVSLIDPDHPHLSKPCDMPKHLAELCKETGQPVPARRGEMTRMIFESMALKYRVVFDKLEKLVGYELGSFHVVGGGCQNALLNQFTANAINKPVIAGPVEATAAGNILSQLQADGTISSQKEGCDIIKRSFEVETYTPQTSEAWVEALKRFEALCS
jgi:sugar (pentulose or hexulose) kinase